MGSTSTSPPPTAMAPAAEDPGGAAPIDMEDPELVRMRRKRRRRQFVVAIIAGVTYYGLAILYYTQRAQKRCTELYNSGANCSDVCWESWSPTDAVYFATVTMTSVGYGDLKPEGENAKEVMAFTLVFLLVGFIVRCRRHALHQAAAATRSISTHAHEIIAQLARRIN